VVRYFFVQPERVFSDTLILEERDSLHIRKVLRKRKGDLLDVSDGIAFLYQVAIVDYRNGEMLCAIRDKNPLKRTKMPRVILLSSLPKGERMDWMIQKSTEVGVDEIVPVQMERSVRVLSPDKLAHRMSRWRRIARNAASQCGRAEYPQIHTPLVLGQALDRVQKYPLKVFSDTNETHRTLREVHKERLSPEKVVLLIGPEGGVTEKERALLLRSGFVPVILGKTILRVETAGILAVALIRYEWDQGDPGSKEGKG
jgi:16S rRNA (uracil1498-N3)-methyltransferase